MDLVGIFVLAALALAGWYWWRRAGGGGGGGAGLKCRTCRHCRRLDADGVMCAFGTKQVFKNPAQIDMCPDHTPR
jgi:hypothetical protein